MTFDFFCNHISYDIFGLMTFSIILDAMVWIYSVGNAIKDVILKCLISLLVIICLQLLSERMI